MEKYTFGRISRFQIKQLIFHKANRLYPYMHVLKVNFLQCSKKKVITVSNIFTSITSFWPGISAKTTDTKIPQPD